MVGARNAQQFGQAIRARRLARGWTQAELAKQAHVSRAFVNTLECATREGLELGRTFAVLRALGAVVTIEDDTTPSSDELIRRYAETGVL